MNATLAPAPVKPRRHHYGLEAWIDETGYGLFPVRRIEDPEVEKAWTFAKRADPDAVYTVARRAGGRITCECPDFVTRHEDHGTLCKHGECCVRMGLLEAPEPAPAPGPRPETARMRVREEFDPPGSPAFLPVDATARAQAEAFGIALPGPVEAPGKPQEPRRAFGEGLADPEAPEASGDDPGPCCGPSEAEPCRDCLEAPGLAGELAEATDRPALSLVEWLRLQADFYRGFNTDAADLVAEHLAELVTEAEITAASTPGQLRDRRAALASPDDRGPGGAPRE
jgi:hypothetical protein